MATIGPSSWDPTTLQSVFDAGADVLVAGSFVFKAENPTKTIADLKNI